MAEEKAAEKEQPEKEEKPKSKKWYFCCGIIVLIIVGYVGYSIYDSSKGTTTKKTTPAPARNYEFHEPSAEAAGRQIDCLKFIAFRITKKNVLCLNLYQTSAQDITEKLASGSYERVIVYGEKLLLMPRLIILLAWLIFPKLYITRLNLLTKLLCQN